LCNHYTHCGISLIILTRKYIHNLYISFKYNTLDSYGIVFAYKLGRQIILFVNNNFFTSLGTKKMCFLRIFILTFFAICCSSVQAITTDQFNSVMTFLATKPNPNVNVNGIGIYVYDGVNSMDALGPYRVFKTAGLNVFLIGSHKGTITTGDKLQLVVDKSIADISKLDILVIPGGGAETISQTKDSAALAWIKKIDANSIYTTSVCTGSWILGAAELLRGKNATSNWYRAKQILTKYGAIFQQKRWVQDGKYWTSAGVTAGMDMALAIVVNLFGNEYAQAVMLDLEYDPQPPIRGGSLRKTDLVPRHNMLWMYDYYLLDSFVRSSP
jgi:putative intracellular protease/amidase